MKYFYKQNLNLSDNHYCENGIDFFFRGTKEYEQKKYDLIAIKTHTVKEKEKLEELIERYVVPVYHEGDILVISSKVVSMCQGQSVAQDDIKIGWFAKAVGVFFKESNHGFNIAKPDKFQLVLNICGYPKTIFACAASLAGKLVGRKGWFYKVLPAEISGIDGFYEASPFSYYRNHAVLLPLKSERVCQQIEQKYGIYTAISDTNDKAVHICGQSEAVYCEQFYQVMLEDNPAGQDDEQTPFILISDSQNHAFRDYVPVEPVSEAEYSIWRKQNKEEAQQ